jgi:hypothetical protein
MNMPQVKDAKVKDKKALPLTSKPEASANKSTKAEVNPLSWPRTYLQNDQMQTVQICAFTLEPPAGFQLQAGVLH